MDIWNKKWDISDTIILRDIIFFQNKLKRIRNSYETNIDSLEKRVLLGLINILVLNIRI